MASVKWNDREIQNPVARVALGTGLAIVGVVLAMISVFVAVASMIFMVVLIILVAATSPLWGAAHVILYHSDLWV